MEGVFAGGEEFASEAASVVPRILTAISLLEIKRLKKE
jgi:hypothetical protein